MDFYILYCCMYCQWIITAYNITNTNIFNLESEAKKKCTHVFVHQNFNTYDCDFLYLYAQSRHFVNSKMVNWANLVQKLTKIQGKL